MISVPIVSRARPSRLLYTVPPSNCFTARFDSYFRAQQNHEAPFYLYSIFLMVVLLNALSKDVINVPIHTFGLRIMVLIVFKKLLTRGYMPTVYLPCFG